MISIDTILAYCLVTPYILRYRLSPGETPYWFFGLIFLVLFLYLFADLFLIKKRYYSRLKIFLACFLVFAVLGAGIISAILVRHRHGPEHKIHDIILQLESAVSFFIQGENPYTVDYFRTLLEKFPYTEDGLLVTNPALYHFVMPPFYLLFSTLFYFFSITFVQFFDGRLPLVFLILSSLIVVVKSKQKLEKKLATLFFLAFNPATIDYFMEGRSDWFVFSFLFFALWLLDKKKPVLAGVPLAFAFGSKQSVWPIFPFWISYLSFQQKGKHPQQLISVFKKLIPFAFIIAFIFLPFIFWDYQAFFQSTFKFLTGSIPTSYPISGYGLGKLLLSAGLIKDSHQYYPFWIWQIVLGFPLAWFLISRMKKKNSLSLMIFSYTLFLFFFWYCSRYFNNNHISFLSLLVIAGWFFHK